jgi:protein-disulfide isomerase
MRVMNNSRLLLVALCAPALALGACKKADDGATAGSSPAGGAPTSVASGTAPAGGWTEAVAATPDGGFVMGNPDAKVKLIEYGSRTCPHCGHFAEEAMPEIKSKYVATGKVSYEFRDFAIHAPDIAAILLGRCNGAGPFFPILEGMFADQKTTLPKLETTPTSFTTGLQGKSPTDQAAAWADQLGYTAFVGQRGVPEAKARACLADNAAIDAIGKRMQDAQTKFNIDGTPTFIINGSSVGSMEWADLKAKLDAAVSS